MEPRALLLLSVAVFVELAACGSSSPPAARPEPAAQDVQPVATAWTVSQSATGGVLAIAGDRAIAMTVADALMQAHCAGYRLVAEGEEVIGEDRVEPSDGSSPSSQQATEWRLHYECPQPAP